MRRLHDATPVGGYELCYACDSHHRQAGLADAIAFLTYAVAGRESGHLMRGYKARPPVAEHQMVVGLLLLLALEGHTKCAEALANRPVTHWAIVPSLPPRPYEHPLRSLVVSHAQGSEAPPGGGQSSPATGSKPRPFHVQCLATCRISCAANR